VPDTTLDPATQYRALGKTAERVSPIGIGGWHLGLPNVSEQLAMRIVRTAIDRGVNFMDNSWDYNDGASETRMGEALRDGYRDKVFLMTKIDGRSKQEAARQLDYELFKTTSIFDSTATHPEWLGDEPAHVREMMPA
jgi:aryl-alcohol dehydrogenase-like predicted oxidoreductase